MENFKLSNTSTRAAEDLHSADLGRGILVVTDNGKNVVSGMLTGFHFDNYQLSPKHGPVFYVTLQVGSFDIQLKQKTEVTLGDYAGQD